MVTKDKFLFILKTGVIAGIALLSLLFISGQKVYAITQNNSNIPNGTNGPGGVTNLDIVSQAQQACAENPTFSIAEISWISLGSSPLTTTIVVDADASITLQWNVADYYCNTTANPPTGSTPNPYYTTDLTVATEYRIEDNGVTPAIFDGLDQDELEVAPNQGDVWEQSAIQFPFTAPSSSETIQAEIEYQAINQFAAVQPYQFQCVGNDSNNDYGNRASLTDFSTNPECPVFNIANTVTVVINPITTGGIITATCYPPEIEGSLNNTGSPSGQIVYWIYVNSQAAGNSGVTNSSGGFDLTGSELPAELTSLETTGGSAQVSVYSESYQNGAPVAGTWTQVGKSATFSCASVLPIVNLSVSCTATTPYVKGTITDSDATSGAISFYIYADGTQAGSEYTTGTNGAYDITGTSLPTQLTSLENTNGSTQVTIWAEAYSSSGNPVAGSLAQLAGPALWACTSPITPSNGTMTQSCSANPPYVKGTVTNTDAPNTAIPFLIYINGVASTEYTTSTTGAFDINGSSLPVQLIDLEGTSTSAAVTIWAQSFEGGEPVPNTWAQVAGSPPAGTWQCVNPPQGAISTASCTAAPPSVTGYVFNTDVPATAVTFYIYVNGVQSGGPYTTTQPSPGTINAQYGLSGDHGFSISADLPTSLTSLENTNQSAQVTIYAESYTAGAPVANSWQQVGSAVTWQCKAPPQVLSSGAVLTATCTTAPPAVTGYAYNTSVPATPITFYIFVNGVQAGGPYTTTDYDAALDSSAGLSGDHNFSITNDLPAALTSLEGTAGSAKVTIWADNYSQDAPIAPLVQIGGPVTWQCVAPPPAPGNITGSCSLVQRTFATGAELPYPAVVVSFDYFWDPLSGPTSGAANVIPTDSAPAGGYPTGLAGAESPTPTTPGTGILVPEGAYTKVTTTSAEVASNGATWKTPDPGAPTMPTNAISTFSEILYTNPVVTSTPVTLTNPTKGAKPATEQGYNFTLSYTMTVNTFEYSSWTYYIDPPIAQQFSIVPVNVIDNQGGAGSAALQATNCDADAPFMSAPVASCTTGNITFIAEDADHALPANDIYYTVDGSAPVPDPSSSSLNMSTYDQLVAHTVTLTIYDVNTLGNNNYPEPNEGWGSYTFNVSYPKCYTVTCGTADVPATVESSDNGPTPIYFNVSINLGFTPAFPGEPATPSTIDGVLADQFNSEVGIPPDVVNSGILLNKFLSPETGDYTFAWTFVDLNGPSVSCTLPHLVVVAVKPYLRVYNGDVSAGNGFITTVGTLSCSQTAGAGITTWNDDLANAYAGAGAQLAATAIGNIEGFVSADGAANGLLPTDLSFGNSQNVSGDNYGGDFTGSLQCDSDYYYTPIAKTATYYYCPGTAVIQDGQLSGCTNQTTGASGTFDLTALTTATVVKAAAGVDINCPSSYSTTYQCSGPAYATNTSWASAGGLLSVPSLYVETLGNIYISPTVKTINGVYIAQGSGSAGGTIYTCANAAAGNPSTTASTYYAACDSQLIVNGSLVANQIEFGRTFGTAGEGLAGDTAEVPGQGWNYAAEIVNYSPDIWLSDPYASTQSPYEAVTSLPPIL